MKYVCHYFLVLSGNNEIHSKWVMLVHDSNISLLLSSQSLWAHREFTADCFTFKHSVYRTYILVTMPKVMKYLSIFRVDLRIGDLSRESHRSYNPCIYSKLLHYKRSIQS